MEATHFTAGTSYVHNTDPGTLGTMRSTWLQRSSPCGKGFGCSPPLDAEMNYGVVREPLVGHIGSQSQ